MLLVYSKHTIIILIMFYDIARIFRFMINLIFLFEVAFCKEKSITLSTKDSSIYRTVSLTSYIIFQILSIFSIFACFVID